MEWSDVLRRIEGGEGASTEFKRGLGDLGGSGKVLCAFANGDGGLLVLGVDDSGEIVGVKEEPERVQERLTSFLNTGCNKPIAADCGRQESDTGWIHWVNVRRQLRGYEPFTFRNIFWIRRGRSTVAPSPTELKELMNAFRFLMTEESVMPGATVDDIDIDAFRSFLLAQGKDLSREPQLPLEQDLRNASVCDLFDGTLRPTLYGLAVFGRDFQGTSATTNLYIQCAAYAGTDRAADVLSAGDAKGRLEDQVHRAVGWFKSLGHRETYDGLYRTDIPRLPDDLVREALVNAVIHRDYAITGSSVMLEVFDDRVDVTSPGLLPNHMTVERACGGGAPRSRNEMMANAMVVRQLMERRGRGWLLMRRVMRDFNDTEPELVNSEDGGYVRVTFALMKGRL